MKQLRWQILIVVLALVAIAVLLLGRQPALQAEAPVAVTGGIYSEGVVGELERLNPLLSFYNTPDRDASRLIFSSLVRFDSRGIPHLDLAESWGLSRDETTYNFSLREDAIWHNGEPVTSDDVVFTVNLMRDPDMPVPPGLLSFWESIEVKALNDTTLQFILPEPFSPFMDFLAFGVLPSHLLGDLDPVDLVNASFNLQPVGSGPYRFEDLLVEEGEIVGVVLSAFEEHYRQRPYIDQFVVRYYPDSAAALEAYEEGEILGFSPVTTEVLDEVLTEPDLNLYTGRLPELTLIYLNLDNPEVPFFQQIDVRQALMKGLNRQWMVDRILQGQGIPANGPIFPGSWAFYDALEPIDYAPEEAITLLKTAGFTIPAEGGSIREGESGPLQFELLYPDGERHEQIAQAVQRNWEALGVAVTITGVPFDELLEEHLIPRTYQAVLADLNIARTPDPDPYPFWHQAQITGGQNYAQWDDRPASEYLEQARVIVDLEERTRLYRNFQVRFVTQLPALPLFYPVYSYAVDVEVQGVQMGPLVEPADRFATVADWYLLARRSLDVESTAVVTSESPE